METTIVEIRLKVEIIKCNLQGKEDYDTCPTCEHKVVNHSYGMGCLLCAEEKVRRGFTNSPRD